MPEYERRWLVAHDQKIALPSEYQTIEDKYISNTTMRLRKVTSHGGEKTFKLCKKYGPVRVGVEPIVNIYLTEAEYQVFEKLSGTKILKKRYKVKEGSQVYSIDAIRDDLLVCEAEAMDISTLELIPAPSFAAREITGEIEFSGASLSQHGT